MDEHGEAGGLPCVPRSFSYHERNTIGVGGVRGQDDCSGGPPWLCAHFLGPPLSGPSAPSRGSTIHQPSEKISSQSGGTRYQAANSRLGRLAPLAPDDREGGHGGRDRGHRDQVNPGRKEARVGEDELSQGQQRSTFMITWVSHTLRAVQAASRSGVRGTGGWAVGRPPPPPVDFELAPHPLQPLDERLVAGVVLQA